MPDSMQKINFITHLLRANRKLVILGNLGMSGHTQLKRWYQLEETLNVYLQVKNLLHPLRFS